MSEHWSIDFPSDYLRVVKLAPSSLEREPASIAEDLSACLAGTLLSDQHPSSIDIDLTAWRVVDSRLLALLLCFHRECRKRGYRLTVSSPPRLLSEMALRLGVADDLGLGVSRSRDYSQLFQAKLSSS